MDKFELRRQADKRGGADRIQGLENIVSMLQEMEEAAGQVSDAVEETKASAPERNMSLFCRNPAPEAQQQRTQA